MRSDMRTDGIPEVSNENNEDLFISMVDIFVKAGIEDDEQNIDRAHSKGKHIFIKT